jgi:hypothetical protein
MILKVEITNRFMPYTYELYTVESTKQCPFCACTHLLLFTSMQLKRCGDCGAHIKWTLDKDQKPLFC